MPTFNFDDGGSTNQVDTGTNASITFVEDGVSFTLSTTGNAGALNVTNSGTRDFIFGQDNSAGGFFTLDINATDGNTNFGAEGGNIAIGLSSVFGTWDVTLVNENGAQPNQQFNSVGSLANLSFATTETFDSIRFTLTGGSGFLTIRSLTASITCYLTGTAIATPDGAKRVEDLQPGDTLLTACGGTTTVEWLGIQPVDTKLATPAKVNPICITAGAIAENVPARDLFVSPDHAVEIDGILYNATALVNGRSIYQVAQMPLEGFTYYHIDTGAHELVLAEGLASETYLDAVGREAFINGHERADAPIISEMAVPRIVAQRMVPADVKEALDARAPKVRDVA